MQKSIHTPEYAHFRVELKAMRESAKLTQRQLATRLKVTPSWIAKVESALLVAALLGILGLGVCQIILRFFS